jgi:hypothetical protein
MVYSPRFWHPCTGALSHSSTAVVEALAYLHSLGFVHCDVKPGTRTFMCYWRFSLFAYCAHPFTLYCATVSHVHIAYGWLLIADRSLIISLTAYHSSSIAISILHRLSRIAYAYPDNCVFLDDSPLDSVLVCDYFSESHVSLLLLPFIRTLSVIVFEYYGFFP